MYGAMLGKDGTSKTPRQLEQRDSLGELYCAAEMARCSGLSTVGRAPSMFGGMSKFMWKQ